MASDDGERPDADHDIVLLHGRTDDGKGLRALRSRPGRVEAAELREARDGQPLTGDLVKLRPREGSPLLWDVDTLYSPDGQEARAHAGPPRVASEAYRRNWETVFGGGPETDGEAPPSDEEDRLLN